MSGASSPLSAPFNRDAKQPEKNETEREIAKPFCIRLTPSEKAKLRELAGSEPVSVYVRRRLFSADIRQRRLRRPKVDDQALARVLGALGASRLSQNVNQLARASNQGALPVTEDVEQELKDACAAIAEMRKTLMLALGRSKAGE